MLRKCKLILNLPIDSKYVVAWNLCTVVAVIIHVNFSDLGDICKFLLLALVSA